MMRTGWRWDDGRGLRIAEPGKVRVGALVAIGAVALVLFAPLLLSYLYRPPSRTGVGGADSDTPFARSIRLVGVQPDLSDDVLDAEGRKVDTLFAYGGGHSSSLWDKHMLRRDFLLELPDDDEPFLLSAAHVRPAGQMHDLSGSNARLDIRRDGKRLLILSHTFRDTQRRRNVLWRGRFPVEKVDVALCFFHGPPGKGRFTADGPFKPGATVRGTDKFNVNWAVTFPPNTRQGLRGTNIRLTSPFPGRAASVVAYDRSGQRHLAQRRGWRGWVGGAGYQSDYHVENLSPGQIARIAVDEHPQVRTFRNILVRYPGRPNRGYAPYLDEMSRILGRPARQIAQGSLKSTDEAVKVMHVVRGYDVRNVANRLDSVKFADLDAATQKRLRATALNWARQPYPQVRAAGIRLGLRWGGGEFVSPALDILDGPDRSVAASVANALRNCKTLSADDVDRIKRRVLTTDDTRTSSALVRMLCTRNLPGAAEAQWALARADLDRPWLWWPAVQRLRRDRGQIPDRAGLDEPMRLKLILATGATLDDEALAAKAHAKLPGLLTPKAYWMDASVADHVFRNLITRTDVPTATAAMVRCLRGLDGGPGTSTMPGTGSSSGSTCGTARTSAGWAGTCARGHTTCTGTTGPPSSIRSGGGTTPAAAGARCPPGPNRTPHSRPTTARSARSQSARQSPASRPISTWTPASCTPGPGAGTGRSSGTGAAGTASRHKAGSTAITPAR